MSNFFSRTNTDIRYAFKNKETLNRKQLKRKRRGTAALFGLVLCLIQLCTSSLFSFEIFRLNMLPDTYLLMGVIVLFLLLLYVFLTQFTKAHIFGKILSIFLSCVLVFGFIFSSKLNMTLGKILGNHNQQITVDIMVLKSDTAESISDTIKYTYGYNSAAENSLINKAFNIIDEQNNTSVISSQYTTWEQLINELYSQKNIRAIAVSDSMRQMLTDKYNDFESKTKIVGTITVFMENQLDSGVVKKSDEPFIVYLSGNDDYGEISDVGRSDVNILAVVNPKTRQILLVSTPRDYYIPINMPQSDGSVKSGREKLTHAGNGGITNSVDTLANLYGTNVDYYLKINFDGCVDIVDALGGITINSDVDFTNGWEAAPESYHFEIGPNECDGEKTLAFVRERKAFTAGDFQRGKNQEAAISAIINKATSPSILKNYSEILDSISNMMLTNIPRETISNLVKRQLSNSGEWNIQYYSAEYLSSGSHHMEIYDYYADAVDPDYDSVRIGTEMINKILNGDVFDADEFYSSEKKKISSEKETTSSSPTSSSLKSQTSTKK